MSHLTHLPIHHILLADDDNDDCLIFEDALAEIPIPTHLTIARNGEQLMQLLHSKKGLPDLLFLDLNMPRKNGFECLSKIKQNEKLKQLPVIIFSTSFDPDIVNLLYHNGAHHYICKPNEYSQLVKVIHQAINITAQFPAKGQARKLSQPPKAEFVFSPESCYNESK